MQPTASATTADEGYHQCANCKARFVGKWRWTIYEINGRRFGPYCERCGWMIEFCVPLEDERGTTT